jgi:hypothetical protein
MNTMIKVRYNLPSDEMSFIAGRILRNYIRDRKLFEDFSDDFDQEFIEIVEDSIDELRHMLSSEDITRELVQKKNGLRVAVNHFIPLLIIAEEYVKLAKDILNVPLSYFDFNQIIDAVVKKRGWEIHERVMGLIKKIEQYLPELKSVDFPEIIIDDLELLLKNVNKLELEVTELSHRRDLASVENGRIMGDVWELLFHITNASSKVFGTGNWRKTNDYAIERLMNVAHKQRQFIH